MKHPIIIPRLTHSLTTFVSGYLDDSGRDLIGHARVFQMEDIMPAIARSGGSRVLHGPHRKGIFRIRVDFTPSEIV